MSPTFELYRADKALSAIDSSWTESRIDSLIATHPQFWRLYLENIMQIRLDSTRVGVRDMATDPRIKAMMDSVHAEYLEFSEIEAEFYSAFQFYEYYFPGNKAPNVYTLISDFGFFPFIFEDDGLRDGLGISLEMFLGSDFPYRMFTGNSPVFSDYLVRAYNQEHIVKRTLDVLVDDVLGPPPGDRLLDIMIHNGKRTYIVSRLLPEVQDSVLFEFTPAQLAWCEQNERNLWAHYLTEDLLYSNEFSRINKLVNYSPQVPGLPMEAPGRVANWSAFRIVQRFMERNQDVSVVELVGMRNAQQLLELSRYRPR